MLRIVYSNRTEELVSALVESLDERRRAGYFDPFESDTVVVPNRNVSTYLKFELARRRGVVANTHFEYLRRFFRSIADGAGVQLMTRAWLQIALFDLVVDAEFVAGEGLQPVADYLAAAADDESRALRAFQLSGRIARLFEEYDWSRERMLDLWAAGPTVGAGPYQRSETWQRLLWLELLDRRDPDSGPPLVRLSKLFDQLDPSRLELPPRLTVFGLSYVAPAFYKLLERVAAHCEVTIYALNPCMEFWEDVPSGWRVRHRREFSSRAVAQGQLTFEGEDDFWNDEGAPAALRLWGRPGRHNIRMLTQLTDGDFDGRFVDPMDEGDTLLRRLQRDILVRQPDSSGPRRESDDSIVVFDAPTIQREVEAVACEIWALIDEAAACGEPIGFQDIAVVVAERQREAYQARIASVFRDTFDIPHNIVDIRALSDRPYLEASELLAALPLQEISRRNLLRLLTHPNFLATAPEGDPETWIQWAEQLGIRYGADRQDHEGSYVARDVLHWDQGLKRLALGAFMAEPEVAGAAGFGEDSMLVPHELARDELGSAATLIGSVRSLVADARWAAARWMPLASWAEFFGHMFATYLAPAVDEDTFDVLRVTRELDSLAERDERATPVPYAVAVEHLRQALLQLEISRGHYLARGVVVSSLSPMRPIPFQHIFVLGLGERNFPSSDPHDPLDLRGDRWEPGDVGGRDRDEYMFLETILCTRQRLYLSYVGRDDQTGDPLEPSSVVRELRFVLERNYVDAHELKTRNTTQHPLRRYAETYFPEYSPTEAPPNDDLALRKPRSISPHARSEAQAAALSHHLRQWCARNEVEYPDMAGLRSLDEGVARDFARVLALPAPADESGSVSGGPIEVHVSQLRKLLQSPLQARAELHLGLSEEDALGVPEDDDEVFEPNLLATTILLRRVYSEALLAGEAEPDAVWERYQRAALREELDARLPTGVFARFSDARHREILVAWHTNLGRMSVDDGADAQLISFGRAREHARVSLLADPVELEVTIAEQRQQVRLVGPTLLLLDERRNVATFRASPPDRWSRARDRHFVPGYVDYLVLSAAELAHPESTRIVVAPGKPAMANAWVRELPPISRELAREQLVRLVEDLLDTRPPYVLPIEAVCEYRHDDNRKSFARLVDSLRYDRGEFVSFRNGPVRRPEAVQPPDDFEAMIERRFGPFFARERAEERP